MESLKTEKPCGSKIVEKAIECKSSVRFILKWTFSNRVS